MSPLSTSRVRLFPKLFWDSLFRKPKGSSGAGKESSSFPAFVCSNPSSASRHARSVSWPCEGCIFIFCLHHDMPAVEQHSSPSSLFPYLKLAGEFWELNLKSSRLKVGNPWSGGHQVWRLGYRSAVLDTEVECGITVETNLVLVFNVKGRSMVKCLFLCWFMRSEFYASALGN